MLRRRSIQAEAIPDCREVLGLVSDGIGQITERLGDSTPSVDDPDKLIAALGACADRLRAADSLLKPVGGLRLMLDSAETVKALRHHLSVGTTAADKLEARFDSIAGATPDRVERLNHEMLRLRDALWAISQDRLGAARGVADLLGGARSNGAMSAMLSVYQALSALDRLEVRGRDSAGLHLTISNPALDMNDPAVLAALESRGQDQTFGSGSARLVNGVLSIVYKTAAEIGELGDNSAVLRAELAADELLAAALTGDETSVIVLGHTRWASVGLISEPNAHPLNSDTLTTTQGGDAAPPFSAQRAELAPNADIEDSYVSGASKLNGTSSSPHSPSPPYVVAAVNGDVDDNGGNNQAGIASSPYVVAAVNGDVDNYAELLASNDIVVARSITTDSKVIPTLMRRHLAAGISRAEAFRATVNACQGSVAVAAITAAAPDRLQIALQGSGQGLYVGLASDAYIVASEPYGVVEETAKYVRMEGETASSRGQIIELNGTQAGSLSGLTRWSYDGTSLPISSNETVTTEITTRDIDRGDYPHFLLKEINEAPASFRKTLRGRIIDQSETPRLVIGTEVINERIRSGLRDSSITEVVVIGQGTAAVAGSSLAEGLRSLLHDSGLNRDRGLTAHALVATELSAFHLRPDMSNTLVIAISQSGTTTDTNRTVDLVRARGAPVIAVVNRRNSDLVERSDGVLYTSDGRDVEMSVASTKAFYAQVAAGWLLAVAIADEVCVGAGVVPDATDRVRLLRSLLEMPKVMETVLASRQAVAEIAQRLAPSRRHWAVVGNGHNRVAAQEIRIKLSELCYKSIPSDITEDKKHIDLSSEPLVLVCAAGLSDSVADDVAKEVAIFGAHRGVPIVVTDDRDRRSRYEAALGMVTVPPVDPRLVCVPVTMAGHIFGYEAALAIDAGSRVLRQARAAIDSAVAQADVSDEEVLKATAPALEKSAQDFWAGLQSGTYNGHLEASTAARLVTVLRYALGLSSLDSYELELGKLGTPAQVIEDLVEALTQAIDELTRPVDAIRHQAKTVTVGISRSDETIIGVPLVRAVLAAGVERHRLSYTSLRTLAALDPAILEVTGYSRYRVQGLRSTVSDEPATIAVIEQSGIATGIVSRAATSVALSGTKHQVAVDRRVLVARGRHDGRTLVFVPEVSASVTVGITLLHARFGDSLSAAAAQEVLKGYRNRYWELLDAVTETEATFEEGLLPEIAVIDLLTAPVGELADRWRTS